MAAWIPAVVVCQIFAAAMVAWFFAATGPTAVPGASAWFLAIVVVGVGMLVLPKRMAADTSDSGASADEPVLTERAFVFLLPAGGLLWAVGAGIAVATLSPEPLMAATPFVLLAMSGTSLGLSSIRAPSQIFNLLTAVPWAAAHLLVGVSTGGESVLFMVAIAVLGFAALLDRYAGNLAAEMERREMFEARVQSMTLELATEQARARNIKRELHQRITEGQQNEVALREAKEFAERAAQTKADFLATMSHEIRTPMNGVIGMVELLQATELTSKQRRFADTIRRSGEALLGLINDILDFSKIEAGKLKLQHTVFDLRQLIEDVNAMFAEPAARKKIELNCLMPIAEHAAYRGDPQRVRQVLVNLIGNAIKFTENGAVDVDARMLSASEDGKDVVVRFEIRDTGIGIRPENQSHIFDSFQQADGSTTRQFGGTGLGLAICSQLVQLMGGEIGVESEYGRGSTFWFTLKLSKMPSESIAGHARGAAFLSNRRALVADPSDTGRQLVKEQLELWGLEVATCSTRVAAWESLVRSAQADAAFDVVLVDKPLADEGDIGLIQQIRGEQALPQPRIILMGPFHNLEETGNWLAVGVDAYLNKPVRQVELYDAIRLAFDLAAETLSRTRDLPAGEAPVALASAHILVAEDNPVNQTLVTTMLDSFGCSYLLVDNGAEAYSAIAEAPLDARQRPYDMILMDCQMPVKDGFLATREIREWETLFSDRDAIPIVALTANAMEGDRERCLAAGMSDYLAKPFTQSDLRGILVKWLPMRGGENEAVTRLEDINLDLSQSLDLDSGLEPPSAGDWQYETEVYEPLPHIEIESEIEPGYVEAAPPRSETAPPEARSASDSSPARRINQAALETLRQMEANGAANILQKVLKIFIETSPSMLAKMQDAAAGGDLGALRDAAHTLKSSAANVGAADLSELCARLEALARQGDVGSCLAMMGAVESEFEWAAEALALELERYAA